LPPEERLAFVLERLSEQGLMVEPQGGKRYDCYDRDPRPGR
jgi:hypothetical protein